MKLLKSTLIKYLVQLDAMLVQIDDRLFEKKLAEDMLSLGAHATVVVNFALRIYCPLLEGKLKGRLKGQLKKKLNEKPKDKAKEEVIKEVESFSPAVDKNTLKSQIHQALALLAEFPDIEQFDDAYHIHDKAGMKDISLPQSEYVFQFGLPNFYFHLSMVYAIAKANGVSLSKGDFDGIHQYPAGFSF